MDAGNIKIAHHFGGGVYIKEHAIPAGTLLSQHVHEFDHLSYLVQGKAKVHNGERVSTYDGPCCLSIKAGQEHKVQSVTDCLWLCIWPENVDLSSYPPLK